MELYYCYTYTNQINYSSIYSCSLVEQILKRCHDSYFTAEGMRENVSRIFEAEGRIIFESLHKHNTKMHKYNQISKPEAEDGRLVKLINF